MIAVGISNRHVHLTKEVKDILFGEDFNLEIKRELNQPGEFASNSTVTLKTNDGIIENVRIIGPLRKYTQVEILKSDEEVLKISAPLRNSGELNDTPDITLIGPKGEAYCENSVIIANRHIHMTPKDAEKYGVINNQTVKIKKNENIIDDVHIKISETYKLECHLDKDDESKYDIHTFDEVTLIK